MSREHLDIRTDGKEDDIREFVMSLPILTGYWPGGATGGVYACLAAHQTLIIGV
jgi:hypothetical protein